MNKNQKEIVFNSFMELCDSHKSSAERLSIEVTNSSDKASWRVEITEKAYSATTAFGEFEDIAKIVAAARCNVYITVNKLKASEGNILSSEYELVYNLY